MPGQNKIVVDYDFESLLCLGMVSHQSAKEVTRSEVEQWCRANEFPIVAKFSKSLSECIADDRKNAEGVVLTYPSSGLKIKIKIPQYVQLHRVLTGLNVRSVWELLCENKYETISGWFADPLIPDSFKKWLEEVTTGLGFQFSEIFNTALKIFGARPILDPFMPYKESRKALAAYFTKEENRKYSGLLFGLLDGKDIKPSVWKMVEPSGTTTFKVDGE